MPMSALLSALRGAGRQHLTASTVAARQAITGSHVLRLHDYNKVLRKKVPNGHFFESAPFGAGGHTWKVVCYPNGADREYDGYTSLFLKSLRPHDDPFIFDATTARLQASVLDREGKPWRTQTAEHRSFLGYESWGWKDFVKNDDLDLVDDCLTVLCDVTVDDLPLHAEEVVTAAATPPPEPTASALPPHDIWSNKPTDDMVTIHVGGKSFPARRFLLEAHSPLLKEALQNATTGQLHIAGLDAEVFRAMLQFMNNHGPASNKQIKVEPTIADRLLVAAGEYGMEKLKLACGEALRARVDMGSVAAMLTLAERHGCPVLKDACIEFLSRDGNLGSFAATDGFQRLMKDCPSAAEEIADIAVKQYSHVTWQPSRRIESSSCARGRFPEAIWSNKPTDDMVTIHVGGKSFPASRFLLEAHSPLLKEALQNATTGELHIAGLDAEVFKAMLQFMNNHGPACNEKIKVEPTIADRLLVAAGEYGLEKLKLACGEALRARVDMGSVAAMLTLAKRHGCPVLKEACIEFLSRDGNLGSFASTDGFQRLMKDCPSAAEEIADIAVKHYA
ncbi:hypothetical protein QYE76_048550 [Lolium multiflorum]|uniref:BTB domain-containing protein n=1 Tax=Lolium multiflorum TaxID=4521 RepID=A0AAD8SL45_LOLMU|nr:hypothetical protein QYE76_048550 [Lolium multiflorum]